LKQNLFRDKLEMMIYIGAKINIVSFKEKFALIIESLEIHDSFQSIFETIWAMSSK